MKQQKVQQKAQQKTFRNLLTLAALAALCVLVAPAHATTLIYKDFDALVREADGVVVGTVTLIESAKSPQGETYTFVALGDLEVLAGQYDGTDLVLRQLGGGIDGRFLHVAGAPRFAEGERVVVFVARNGRDIVPVAGWTQGVFRVSDERGTEVVADHEGNRVLAIAGGKVEKEARYAGEAELAYHDQGSAGVADDGSYTALVVTPVEKRTASGGEPMTLDRFAAEVRQRAAQADKAASPIESLGWLDWSGVSTLRADATPPGALAADAKQAQPFTGDPNAVMKPQRLPLPVHPEADRE